MEQLHYSDFSLKDFLTDAYFQQQTLRQRREDDLFREEFLKATLHQRTPIAEAKAITGSLRFGKDGHRTDWQVQDMRNRIQTPVEACKSSVEQVGTQAVLPLWPDPLSGWVAAVFIVVLVCATVLFHVCLFNETFGNAQVNLFPNLTRGVPDSIYWSLRKPGTGTLYRSGPAPD